MGKLLAVLVLAVAGTWLVLGAFGGKKDDSKGGMQTSEIVSNTPPTEHHQTAPGSVPNDPSKWSPSVQRASGKVPLMMPEFSIAADDETSEPASGDALNVGAWADPEDLTIETYDQPAINIGNHAVPLATTNSDNDNKINTGHQLPSPDYDSGGF